MGHNALYRSIVIATPLLLGAAAVSQPPLVVVGNRAIAYEYARSQELPQGVAGDQSVVFVTEPLRGQVDVLCRLTGCKIAELPQPPGGPLILPFALRVASPGRLVVLDPGGFPDPFAPPPVARVVEYDYSYGLGGFRARHARTISLAGIAAVFLNDLEVLDNGYYVASEPVIGALWLVSPSGVPSPGVFPASPSPADAIPQLAPCSFPPGAFVDGIPFRLAGDFAPGVGSLESNEDYLFWGSTCAGGVYRLPVAALFDGRQPFERAADIELLSPAPPGRTQPDVMKGLSIDVYGDPGAMYAADPFDLAVVRIDLATGTRQQVVQDPSLFDFPVQTAFLPPVLGISPLIVVSDQEHRWPAINVALTEELFRKPFRIAKVQILR